MRPPLDKICTRIAGAALDLLFPIPCAGCGREGKIICERCIPDLPKLTSPYCAVCASPDSPSPCRWCNESSPAFDGIRAPFLMEGIIKQAVHSFKYRSVRAAAPELGRLLAAYLSERRIPGETLVPVPLHSRRLQHRGYNQSRLLAREVARRAGLRLDHNVLKRTKDGPPQVEAASPAQRRSNVEGSFQCTRDLTGQKLILVDDVATTGSTFSACAASLKAAGASSVWGLALAREK